MGRRSPARPRRRRPPAVLLSAVVAIPLAAGLGVVLGGGSDNPPAPRAAAGDRTLTGGKFSIDVPAGWRTTAAPLSATLGLTDAAAAAPPGASAGQAIVVGRSSGSGATLLPAALVRSLPKAPTGQAVRLGDLQAWRYTGLRPAGGPATTVFAAPTTDGVATVACVGVAVQPSCGHIATTLRAAGADPLALGPHAAYAKAVDGALSKLARARSAGLRGLTTAGSRRAQATAAAGVATAYARARTTLLRAPVSPAEREAHAALLSSLERAAAAWRALGTAAGHGDGSGYAAARARVTAREAAVRRATAALRRLGYTVK